MRERSIMRHKGESCVYDPSCDRKGEYYEGSDEEA
jgi:hypothetical protein